MSVEVQLDDAGAVVDSQAHMFRKANREARSQCVHMARPRISRDLEEQTVCTSGGGALTSDPSKVTCKRCKALMRRAATTEEVTRALAQGLLEAFDDARAAVSAPRLTPDLWATSCKGAVDGRCRHCASCARDAEIERYNFAAPWKKQHRARRQNAPMWSSVDAAVQAWVSFAPTSPSPTGPMLDKARDGLLGGQQGGKGDDRNMDRAGDLVIITKLLELAYPRGGHPRLTPGQCIDALIERCAPAPRKDDKPTGVGRFPELAEGWGCTVGDVRAAVRHGRTFLQVELGARGLVATPSLKGPMTAWYVSMLEAIETRRAQLEATQRELAAAPRKWVLPDEEELHGR